MIRRSSSSTRRAGATGPRRASAWAARWSWASDLRNAWDSYHLSAHCVNPLDFSPRDARSFPGSIREGVVVARTPLLRAFQKLAEEHRSADQLGISPAELRGRRQEEVSRREFLKRAGVAGAAGIAARYGAFARAGQGAAWPRN